MSFRDRKVITNKLSGHAIASEDDNADMDIPDDVHCAFLENVKQIHGANKISPATRCELASEVSVFNIISAKKAKKKKPEVHENDLIRAIKKKQLKVSQKLENVNKKKSLPKPLASIHERRAQRELGFQEVKKKLNRWHDAVMNNRVADQIQFPLQNKQLEIYDFTDSSGMLSSSEPTPLEVEFQIILNQSEVFKKDKQKMEKSRFRLTLKEMSEKRSMIAKAKAQASHLAAKAKRQNKIKSKKYHRILRHERTKLLLKDFETLQKTDPEAALKQLEQLEKNRAVERATLRHRNTGKWARNQIVKAKYNKESRIAISEQLNKNRELTRKIKDKTNTDESASSDSEEKLPIAELSATNNPKAEHFTDYNNFISSYKKFWEEKKKEASTNSVPPTSDILNKKTSSATCDVSDAKSTTVEIEPISKVKITASRTLNNYEKKLNEKNKNVLNIKTPENVDSMNEIKFIQKSKPDFIETIVFDEFGGKKLKKKKNKTIDKTGRVSTILNNSGLWDVTEIMGSDDNHHADLNPNVHNMFNSLEKSLNQKFQDKIMNVINLENEIADQPETKKKSLRVHTQNASKFAEENPPSDILSNTTSSKFQQPVGSLTSTENIDPNKFLKVPQKRLGAAIPDIVDGGEEGIDDDDIDNRDANYQMTINEAFAEDDVVTQFQEEKAKAEEDGLPKVMDNSLPGWGMWTDAQRMHKESTKKRRQQVKNKRLLFKVPKGPPRKDINKGHVIINEEKSDKLKEHMVKELPYPFTRVEDFEANIRAPIGRTWIPETAHQQLIAPAIVTKLGTVIEPIDEGMLVAREA